MRAETTTCYIGLTSSMEMFSPSSRKRYKIGFVLGSVHWHVVDSAGAASWVLLGCLSTTLLSSSNSVFI